MLISTILILVTVLIAPSCENPARSRTSETTVRPSKLLTISRNSTSTRARRQQSSSSSSSSSSEASSSSSSPSTVSNMQIELTPTKRPQAAGSSRAASTSAAGVLKKRFKSSLNSSQAGTRNHDEVNNNVNSNDLNNNSIMTGGDQRPSWRRTVDSINGTIDLSQYQQTDVDRLYGDALLVYFKNFNENIMTNTNTKSTRTLPTRRETITVNGTAANQIPIYQSVPQTPRDSRQKLRPGSDNQ